MFHVVKKCIKPRAANDGNLCRRHVLSMPGPYLQRMPGTADHGVVALPAAHVTSSSGTNDGWTRITDGSREIADGWARITDDWARITDGWSRMSHGKIMGCE